MSTPSVRADDQLAAIIESSRDAIVSQTPDGAISTWNTAAERLYGYSAAEAIGAPATILDEPGASARDAAVIDEVLGGRRVDHYETSKRRKDGTAVEVSLTASPIKDSSGSICGVSTSARDIAERKRLERELVSLREELEARNHALERSNAELAQFASVASHDLSEPLRAITGFLELMLRRAGDALDDEGRRYVGEALGGAARMRSLIEDLLVLARVDSTDAPLREVDVEELLALVIRQFSPAIGEHGGSIAADGPLPTVHADATQLGQVLQNLVANAVKFCADEPPHVVVRAQREPGAWRISVSDNGIGIDPAHRERIFRPFKRLHTRDSYPGTGIGLALALKIVERHGGRIWCSPNEPRGTTFTFTIPDGNGHAS